MLSPGAARAAKRGLNELRDGVGEDAYWRQRTWKRVAVIVAGPAANLVFAVVLLAVVYMIGIPSAASRRVDAIEQGTPAAHAGLKSGDTIIGVNRVATRTFDEVRHAIQTSHGHPLALYVIHGNGELDELPAVKPVKRSGTYILGFRPAIVRYKHYGPIQAVGLAGRDVGYVTKAMGTWIVHAASPAEPQADLDAGRDRPNVQRGRAAGLPRLPRDPGPDQPLARAAQPAAAAAARRRAHGLLDHRGHARPGGGPGRLRARLDGRDRAGSLHLRHRHLERHRQSPRRLSRAKVRPARGP